MDSLKDLIMRQRSLLDEHRNLATHIENMRREQKPAVIQQIRDALDVFGISLQEISGSSAQGGEHKDSGLYFDDEAEEESKGGGLRGFIGSLGISGKHADRSRPPVREPSQYDR